MNKHLGKTLWIIAAAVFFSGMLMNSQLQKENTAEELPASSSSSYDLKVEGTGNGPVPLDFDLQGSRNKTDSENNLQKTDSADVLQPNAKQRDF